MKFRIPSTHLQIAAFAAASLFASGSLSAATISAVAVGTLNSGSIDSNNVFGQGVNANLSGQQITVSFYYDAGYLAGSVGNPGSPNCTYAGYGIVWGFADNMPCQAPYGWAGYTGSATSDVWTGALATATPTIGVTYTVGGVTLALDNDSDLDANRHTDVEIGSSFQYNTYDIDHATQQNAGLNYRLFLNGVSGYSQGDYASQAEMNAFVASATSGSAWFGPIGGQFEVLSFSNVHAVEVSETPEPGTIALFGAGLVGLIVRRRASR